MDGKIWNARHFETLPINSEFRIDAREFLVDWPVSTKRCDEVVFTKNAVVDARLQASNCVLGTAIAEGLGWRPQERRNWQGDH